MQADLLSETRFMQLAIQLAVQNVESGRGGPFGAVIVKDGKLIAQGVNMVTALLDPTAHAEVTAIRQACAELQSFELKGCSIYSSCEPCPMCLAAILWARCDRLYFASTAQDAKEAGFDDSHFYEQVAKPFTDRELPASNLLRQEGAKSFAAWRTFAGKIEY